MPGSTRLYDPVVTAGNHTLNISFRESAMAQQVWRIGSPILLVVGTVANLLSILVLTRPKLRKTTTMFYLAVLAFADLAVLYTGLLRLWLDNAFGIYIRLQSTAACRVHMFLVYFFLDFSVWILVAVTVDRCLYVSAPFTAKRWCTLRRARGVVVIIAAVLFLINMHYLWTITIIYRGEKSIAGDESYTCHTSDNSQTAFFVEKVWPWIDFCDFCFIPFLVMVVCNSLIIRQLVLSTKKLRRHAKPQIGVRSYGESPAVNIMLADKQAHEKGKALNNCGGPDNGSAKSEDSGCSCDEENFTPSSVACQMFGVSAQPDCALTSQPDCALTSQPDCALTSQPDCALRPTSQPDCALTSQPDCALTSQPDCALTSQPDCALTSQPDCALRPTSQPDCALTSQPDCALTSQPDCALTSQPDCALTSQPDCALRPTSQPDCALTLQPDCALTSQPDCALTSQPDCAVGPTSQPDCALTPTSQPDCALRPTSQPDCALASQPDCALRPTSHCQEALRPSLRFSRVGQLSQTLPLDRGPPHVRAGASCGGTSGDHPPQCEAHAERCAGHTPSDVQLQRGDGGVSAGHTLQSGEEVMMMGEEVAMQHWRSSEGGCGTEHVTPLPARRCQGHHRDLLTSSQSPDQPQHRHLKEYLPTATSPTDRDTRHDGVHETHLCHHQSQSSNSGNRTLPSGTKLGNNTVDCDLQTRTQEQQQREECPRLSFSRQLSKLPRRQVTQQSTSTAESTVCRCGIPNVTLMLLTVNSLFWLLTAPVVVFVIGYAYWAPQASGQAEAQLSLVWSLVNMLQYTNNAIHFFLYCLTGPKFRQELAVMWRRSPRHNARVQCEVVGSTQPAPSHLHTPR